MTESESETSSNSSTNKIDRVMRKYDILGMGVELENRWLGVDGDQKSTRELADYFNRQVLISAVDDSDVFTITGEIDHVYQSLTEKSQRDGGLVRNRLKQTGVDVEEVLGDFISHQTIYRYLKNNRNVTRPEQTADERKENAINSINRVRGRTTAVTEKTIETLRNSDTISVGDFKILNDLQLLCEQCGHSYDVVTFLEQGSCECEE